MVDGKVVVVTEATLAQKLEVSEWCHEHGVAFVAAETRGVFGSVFCDFGEAHVVLDPNGEPPFQQMIVSATRDKPGVVTILDDRRLQLETGDLVKFTEVRGMTQLNDSPPRPITVLGTAHTARQPSSRRPGPRLLAPLANVDDDDDDGVGGGRGDGRQGPTPFRSKTRRTTTSTSPAATSSKSSPPRLSASYAAPVACGALLPCRLTPLAAAAAAAAAGWCVTPQAVAAGVAEAAHLDGRGFRQAGAASAAPFGLPRSRPLGRTPRRVLPPPLPPRACLAPPPPKPHHPTLAPRPRPDTCIFTLLFIEPFLNIYNRNSYIYLISI